MPPIRCSLLVVVAAVFLIGLTREAPAADEIGKVTPQQVLDGLKAFWQKTARADAPRPSAARRQP